MIAQDIMTANPIRVDITTSLQEVAEQLFAQDVRHLPVVRGQELVGIVSSRDLAPYTMGLQKNTGDLSLVPVGEILTTDVLTVNTEHDISEVIELMIDHRVGAIPVIEAGTRHLQGIISYVDVLKTMQERL